MSRGFFTLTSQMLTQQRRMDISSNNIANSNTPGFMKERAVSTTFGELLLHKVEGQDGREELIQSNVIKILDGKEIIRSQGNISSTGSNTDFAIMGDGYFQINDGGQQMYTRYGKFNVDAEGFLESQGVGRVQGEDGDVYIGTDDFEFTDNGEIYVDDELVSKINIYSLNNANGIVRVNENTFASNEQPVLVENSQLLNGSLELSNVNYTEELTDIMASQRALQTAAQALKIYDKVQEAASTEIGRVN